MWGTPIYSVWASMKSRCNNKNNPKWHRYGGRGITYSKKWENFNGFYEQMKMDYRYGLTLDRIDNNGNYCRENCRWTDRKTQQNNMNANKTITLDGKTKTIHQWSIITGINPKTIDSRMRVYGWSIKKTLTVPVKKYKFTRKNINPSVFVK